MVLIIVIIILFSGILLLTSPNYVLGQSIKINNEDLKDYNKWLDVINLEPTLDPNCIQTSNKVEDGIFSTDGFNNRSSPLLSPYVHPSLEFKLTVPSGWEQIEQNTGVSFLSPSSEPNEPFRQQMSIDILTDNFTTHGNFNDIVAARNQSLSSYQNFTLLQIAYLCLQNQNALVYTYTYFSPIFDSQLIGFDAIIPGPNKIYVISFFSTPENYSSYLPSISYMLNSFDFDESVYEIHTNLDSTPHSNSSNSQIVKSPIALMFKLELRL